MQNLLLSRLVSAAFGLLWFSEIGWFKLGFGFGLSTVLIVTIIETAITRIISANKTGSSEIKLIDIGRTGCVVGSDMDEVGFGS